MVIQYFLFKMLPRVCTLLILDSRNKNLFKFFMVIQYFLFKIWPRVCMVPTYHYIVNSWLVPMVSCYHNDLQSSERC